jgi:ABC-2 type transport system ATP-binding protein
MIELVNLTKKYDTLTAVDHIDLKVSSGEILGFLGPNGAGKTTTIKMMAGILKPTEGTAIICGHDIVREPVKAKQTFGFIPDRPFIYEKLSGSEFLRFVGRLYGMNGSQAEAREAGLLELFELTRWKDALVASFSHGMKQRLVMASALLHNPRALIIDEPMVGLDPKAARLVKRIFREVARSGVTVFLSTHSLEVAEETCDRIAIIMDGRILTAGTVEDLGSEVETDDDRLESIFLKLTGGMLTDVGDFLRDLQELPDGI